MSGLPEWPALHTWPAHALCICLTSLPGGHFPHPHVLPEGVLSGSSSWGQRVRVHVACFPGAQGVPAVGARRHQSRQPSDPHSDLTLCLLKHDPSPGLCPYCFSCTEAPSHSYHLSALAGPRPTGHLGHYSPPPSVAEVFHHRLALPSRVVPWADPGSGTCPIPPAGLRGSPGLSLKLIQELSQPWASGSCTTERFYRPIA